jgi:hypothetical protein
MPIFGHILWQYFVFVQKALDSVEGLEQFVLVIDIQCVLELSRGCVRALLE